MLQQRVCVLPSEFQLPCLPAKWPWAGSLTFLRLSFFMFKLRKITPLPAELLRDPKDNAHESSLQMAKHYAVMSY